MQIVVGIDDTDQTNWEQGTGRLVSALIAAAKKEIDFSAEEVVRHQLLVHPDIAYTSHNSSMSFRACLEEESLENLLAFTADYLRVHRAPGSDPGFCLYRLQNKESEKSLIMFGKEAKQQVLSKSAAYRLAAKLGVHLSEHGGTGDGVIGALAAVGLRLSGSDGRFRGRFEFCSDADIYTAEELRQAALLDKIQNLEGEELKQKDLVKLQGKVKSVLIKHQKVLLVTPNPGSETKGGAIWQNCSMDYLRQYH